MPPDIVELQNQFEAAARDAGALVTGLEEERAGWRSDPGSWSVSECLDHLATTNGVYLAAMQQPARRAREARRLRKGPAKPGFVGRWFVKLLEPPVKPKLRSKSPKIIEPRRAPALRDAFDRFLLSSEHVTAFLQQHADLDLASIRFPNPLLRGVRFSLATGLHVIAAHERRHLGQAWRVRKAAEQSGR